MNPRSEIKEHYSESKITKKLTDHELVKHAKERPVHEKDKDHDGVPTINHIQLILDNIKERQGKRSDLADVLISEGYTKDLVGKIMSQIDIYQF